MAVVRWVNLICGTLLVVAVLGFSIFLSVNLTDYAREPEDVWLAGFWIALLGLIAALCFVNARCWSTLSRWRTLANIAVVGGLAALLLLARDDPTVPPLLTLCAMGPIATLISMWRRSQFERS